ncbi:MAG: GTP cyclohydrolase I [Anaerolineales bacterium]
MNAEKIFSPAELVGLNVQGASMEFDEELNARSESKINIETTSRIIRELIEAVGEDPEREGLKNTPDRVARMYTELLSGYTAEPERIVNGALFDIAYDEMVIVRDIEFYSLCEHHMLPFIGRAHVAYIPKRQSDRSLENSAHRGYVRAAIYIQNA